MPQNDETSGVEAPACNMALRSKVFGALRHHNVSDDCFAEVAAITHAALTRTAHAPQAQSVVEALKSRLRGEVGEEYTDAGMQDAFFRWPIVERELLAALSQQPDEREGSAALQGQTTGDRDGVE